MGGCQVMEMSYLKLIEPCVSTLSVFRSMLGVFLCLEFPFLPLIWREVPYPLRPCSSATRSVKLFLFSFPAGINSTIFYAPQNFIPVLLQHNHVFLVDLGAFLPSLPDCDLFEQVVCI